MIFLGEASLRQAVEEFVTHYNHERNDQALDNKIIQPDVPQFPMEGEVRCRKRDGGLLRYYTEKPHHHMHMSFWTARARTTGGKKYPCGRRPRFLIILLPLTLAFQNFVLE